MAVTVATRLAEIEHEAPRLAVERGHDFAVGQREQLAGVVHVAGMFAEAAHAPGPLGATAVEPDKAQGRLRSRLASAFGSAASHLAAQAVEAG